MILTQAGAAVLAATLAVVSVTDLRRRVIPNRILLAAAAVGLALASRQGPGSLLVAVVCSVLASGPLLVIALIRPAGIGMGDVKLAAVVGLFLGWQAWPALLTGLALATLAGGLASLGSGRPPSQTAVPLAPFVAAGTLPVLLPALLLQ
ncbi:MAG: prepilin peptidase [Solirubrobacterales bacterium]|nr:prepilin peptidase [Solirubrobacterales bacterium]